MLIETFNYKAQEISINSEGCYWFKEGHNDIHKFLQIVGHNTDEFKIIKHHYIFLNNEGFQYSVSK
jgi:hypothetical protein